MDSAGALFTIEEVKRAGHYHRPLYIALLVDTTLGLVVLLLLVFTRAGSWLYAVVDELSWWGRALLFPILVLGVLTLLRLPLSFWRGHVRERRWGFSTQTARGGCSTERRASQLRRPRFGRRARFRRADSGTGVRLVSLSQRDSETLRQSKGGSLHQLRD
jgi:CAAX prenyl protease N-terminal, five membrane helices